MPKYRRRWMTKGLFVILSWPKGNCAAVSSASLPLHDNVGVLLTSRPLASTMIALLTQLHPLLGQTPDCFGASWS